MVLDLKDAFVSVPLAVASEPVFTLEWSDPEHRFNGQLTWTRLPQGFKNSPIIFSEALHEDFSEYGQAHPQITLLKSIDDLLIAAPDEDTCHVATYVLPRELDRMG